MQTVEELGGCLENCIEEVLGVVRSSLTAPLSSSSPTAAAETELAFAPQPSLEIVDKMPARAYHGMDLNEHCESTAPENKNMLMLARE